MSSSIFRLQAPCLLTSSGRRLELRPGRSLTLGRGVDCDLTLEDSGCSRRHARLEPHAAGCRLADLGSTNGTFLNGRRLTGPAELSEGDRVRCGSTFLLYRTRGVGFEFELTSAVDDDTVSLAPGTLQEPAQEILTGSLDAIALVELLQVLLQARLDGRLEFAFPDGPATLELRDGEIRAANYRSARGLPALFAMALRGKAGSFRLERSDSLADEGEMRLDLEKAMFQLCRVLDEYECPDEDLEDLE